ncbi:MAG: mannosyl-3-phosphoglycerate phosphatase, partial [Candidatus Eiseniibacteriota bacterium]
AELSMMREYTEPFILEGERTEEALRAVHEAVGGLGLRLTAGEKFLHLSGTHHKGELVARLSVLFRTLGDEVRTVGLGDGKNDVEMLAECDVAVLVRKKSGLLEEEIVSRVPGAFAYEAGPTGWNKAVIDLLEGKIP